MTTGTIPIWKAIIYLVTFCKVASVFSGFFFFFTVTDLLLSPPLINCCYLNVMKLKTEIKPVVQAMTLGQPTGDCGSLLCNISTPLRCALRETVWDRRAKGPPRG